MPRHILVDRQHRINSRNTRTSELELESQVCPSGCGNWVHSSNPWLDPCPACSCTTCMLDLAHLPRLPTMTMHPLPSHTAHSKTALPMTSCPPSRPLPTCTLTTHIPCSAVVGLPLASTGWKVVPGARRRSGSKWWRRRNDAAMSKRMAWNQMIYSRGMLCQCNLYTRWVPSGCTCCIDEAWLGWMDTTVWRKQ